MGETLSHLECSALGLAILGRVANGRDAVALRM